MDNLPYLTAALICERVLQEKDGSLSVIRIVDRAEAKIHVQGDAPIEQMQQAGMNPTLQLMMLVGIKSGSFKGKGLITIEAEKPSGEKTPNIATLELDFTGGDQGQNIIVNLQVQLKEQGLHWLNIQFNGSLLTRVPFTLALTVERVGPDGKTIESPVQ